MMISVSKLKERLDSGDSVQLVDVREQDEWNIGHLPNATLIPLSQFTQRALVELDKDTEYIFYCHHGMRSQQAQHFLLQEHGFKNILNLTGGIDAWSIQIDPGVKRY